MRIYRSLGELQRYVDSGEMMRRIFYVDVENGDDNNDGSSSAPFRTIKKACDSVPIGGKGVIYIPRGQTLHINDDIELIQKYIQIEPYGSGDNPVIEFDTYVDTFGSTDYNFSYSFKLNSSFLNFHCCVLQNAPKADSSLDWETYYGAKTPITVFMPNSCQIYFRSCTVNQTRDYFMGGWSCFVHLMTTVTTINFSEDAVALITAVDGGGLLAIRQTTATTNYKWIDPGTIGSNVITNLSSLDT